MDASIVPDEEYSLSLSTTKTLTEVGIADEDAQQTRGVVDVLILPPPRSEEILTEADLNAILIREVFIDSCSEVSAPSSELQTKLRTAYQCNVRSGLVRCMLLDIAFPSEAVITLHILRQKHRHLASILFDIDDVQKGLLLFEPLKRAYDAFQLSFLYVKHSDQFYLKLFDSSIRRKCFLARLSKLQRAKLLDGHTHPNKKKCGKSPWFLAHTILDTRTMFGDLWPSPSFQHNQAEHV